VRQQTGEALHHLGFTMDQEGAFRIAEFSVPGQQCNGWP
jgi:hypothetical protein